MWIVHVVFFSNQDEIKHNEGQQQQQELIDPIWDTTKITTQKSNVNTNNTCTYICICYSYYDIKKLFTYILNGKVNIRKIYGHT